MFTVTKYKALSCYGSLSREASSKSASRFLGSKLRSECFTELRQIGLSLGECVFREVCEGVCKEVCKEVCEGVCVGLQVKSGVEVLPTENLAWSLLRQKEKQEFNIM
ncbi:hypothetical protein PDJAM_G00032740, partial [Pangasius djambal]|nr:hypothetical protein [Pangasius djambal]